jgi:hypothetical protein
MGDWRVPAWREVYRKRYGLTKTAARKCPTRFLLQLDNCKDDAARRLLIPNQSGKRKKA